jgi:hypothetical protein
MAATKLFVRRLGHAAEDHDLQRRPYHHLGWGTGSGWIGQTTTSGQVGGGGGG